MDILTIALWIVGISLFLASYRLYRGPTLPDRIVALDTVTTNLVVAAVLEAFINNQPFYLSIALVLAVVTFLGTVAVAKFLTEGEIIDVGS